LIDFTRSRLGGGIPIYPTSFNMDEICRQVIGETELTHPERSLRLDVRGDLSGVWDRDRLYQLVANLVGNAVQHGEPRAAIEVRIDGRDTDVVIEVANRGDTIPPAAQQFIFDAFRRGGGDGRVIQARARTRAFHRSADRRFAWWLGRCHLLRQRRDDLPRSTATPRCRNQVRSAIVGSHEFVFVGCRYIAAPAMCQRPLLVG